MASRYFDAQKIGVFNESVTLGQMMDMQHQMADIEAMMATINPETVGTVLALYEAGNLGGRPSNRPQLNSRYNSTPQYSSRIRARAVQDPGGHNFPSGFDKPILQTTPTTLRGGGYGYALRGFKNGKEVIYNIIVKNGQIVHRDMVSVSKWSQRSKSFGWPVSVDDIPWGNF